MCYTGSIRLTIPDIVGVLYWFYKTHHAPEIVGVLYWFYKTHHARDCWCVILVL